MPPPASERLQTQIVIGKCSERFDMLRRINVLGTSIGVLVVDPVRAACMVGGGNAGNKHELGHNSLS